MRLEPGSTPSATKSSDEELLLRIARSHEYLLAGLWGLSGVILIAAGTVMLAIPSLYCNDSGLCVTSASIPFYTIALWVSGVALLLTAVFKSNQVE